MCVVLSRVNNGEESMEFVKCGIRNYRIRKTYLLQIVQIVRFS